MFLTHTSICIVLKTSIDVQWLNVFLKYQHIVYFMSVVVFSDQLASYKSHMLVYSQKSEMQYNMEMRMSAQEIKDMFYWYWRISARAASVYRDIQARRKQFQVREFPVCIEHEWAEISFWHE